MKGRIIMQFDTSVINSLIEQNKSITAAESLTAGLFQATLGEVSGVSKIFPGGFVTYSNEAKAKLLQIPEPIIQACGVVSSEVAIWMAQQSRQIMNTNIGVSFTGVAGPDGLEGHSAGTVFIGLDYDGMQSVKQCHFEGTRQEVREQSVAEALELLKLHLK